MVVDMLGHGLHGGERASNRMLRMCPPPSQQHRQRRLLVYGTRRVLVIRVPPSPRTATRSPGQQQ